jgi:hypothetical protein
MIIMKWSWEYVARYLVEQECGGFVNWTEEYYICPECEEPIYKEDYPMIDIGMMCPVCEAEVEEPDYE